MNHIRSSLPEERRPKELVLFDVDGTIIPDNTDELTGKAYWAMTEAGLITPSEEIKETLSTLQKQYEARTLENPRDYLNPLILSFDEQLRGKSCTQLGKIATEIVAIEYEQNAYPEVVEEIHRWREQGVYIGLISGSPDFIIQALKRKMGADIATGTRYYHNQGYYHQSRRCETRSTNKDAIAERMLIALTKYRIHGLGHTSEKTPKRLGEFDLQDQFTLRSSYGDTQSDYPMLMMSSEPVAVAPKQNLRELYSGQQGWKVLHDTPDDLAA